MEELEEGGETEGFAEVGRVVEEVSGDGEGGPGEEGSGEDGSGEDGSGEGEGEGGQSSLILPSGR